MSGYVQIINENYICGTISNPITTVIKITGEKTLLVETEVTDSLFVSQRKYRNVLGTFEIPLSNTLLIFQHAKDKVLDAVVENGVMTVVGDDGKLLLHHRLEGYDESLEKRGVTIEASKLWLKSHNIEFF